MESVNVEDLFDIVDTVARLVGGPVAVEDADFRVLAYSTVPGQPNDEARRAAILDRRTPDRWLRWMDESGFRERLLASEDPVRLDIPWGAFLPRYIQPVRHGGHVVGFLWLMQGETPLADDMVATARETAAIVAPELARRSSSITQNPQARLLRQFLAGALPPARLGAALGVDEATVPTVVVTFDVAVDTASGATADAVAARPPALRALATHADAHLRGALVGSVDQQIYLLQADPAVARSVVPALDHAAEYVARVLDRPVRAAAGGVHVGLGHASLSRAEADDTLRVLDAAGPVTTGRFEQLRHAVVLHEVMAVLRDRPTLAEGLLAPLDRHDAERGTDYVSTLATYLEEFGDVRRTAARLHLHPNSLRYRLRRVEEIAAFDLGDPDLRVALQLVCAVRRRAQR